jgi:hypothetical protein
MEDTSKNTISGDQASLSRTITALSLTQLMIKALADMDQESATALENIAYELECLGLFDKDLNPGYETDSLFEALISDYIYETNNGAVKDEDYTLFNVSASAKPTVEELQEHEVKLTNIVKDLKAKIEKEHSDKIGEIMKKDNSKWRKN